MAISSVLTPEKITGRQRPSVGAAQNFISGGSVLGSSVVSSAANKIVGFQRTAAVRPVIPDVNSIISSISSNIVNNLNNTLNQSSGVVQNTVENKIQNFKNEIFKVIKNIENKIEQISVLTNQKNEIIEYVNNTNLTNKKEIIQEVNKISSFAVSNKQELIQYIKNTNLESKQEIINLINQTKNDITINKNELIDYIEKTSINKVFDYIQNTTVNKNIFSDSIKNVSNSVSNSNVKIDNIESSFNLTKKELIEFIQKTNIENKQSVIQLINENKKEIVNSKTDLIEYVNNTVIQSNVVKKVENLENVVNQVRADVAQSQSSQSVQQEKFGIGTQLRQVVQNVRENVNETLSKTITNLTTEYRKKVQEVDSAKPTGILQKFIDAYNTAFGFAQFFSNRKNIARLKDNLSAIKDSFTESFSTAKLLRQVIIKIVKQLSNLPKATSSGGGGFNVDVDIPGPKMKQSLPRSARGMGRGKMLAMGAGALGLGAAGAATVNALADTGQVQPVAAQPMIPGNVVDQFSIIVDRFTNAVDNLIKGATGNKKTQAMAKPSGGGGGGVPSSGSPGGGTSGGGTPGGPADFSGSGNEEKAFNYFISQGYTKEQAAGIVGNLMQENRALNPTVANSIGHKGIAQWDPKDRYPKMVAFAKSKGLDPNTLEAQLQFVEQELKTGSGGLSKGRLQGTKSVEEAAVLVRKQYLRPGEAEAMDSNRIRFGQQVLSKYGGKVQPGKPGIDGKTGAPGKDSISSTTTIVEPSKLVPSAKSTTAQAISQPPPSQAEPQVNIMSLDMTGGQKQQQQSSAMTAPSSGGTQKSPGPTIPLLPASNPENFLVLYSRMVYNIVDG